MKNKTRIALFTIVSLIAIAIIVYGDLTAGKYRNNTNSVETQNSTLEMELIAYEYYTADYISVDTETITKMIKDKQKFFLYTGRITCQWCRALVPVLSELALDTKLTIYYLDSENTEENIQLKAFRQLYNIELVPSILFFDDNGSCYVIEHDVTSNKFGIDSLAKAMSLYVDKINAT